MYFAHLRVRSGGAVRRTGRDSPSRAACNSDALGRSPRFLQKHQPQLAADTRTYPCDARLFWTGYHPDREKR